jgi:hypothetical protein
MLLRVVWKLSYWIRNYIRRGCFYTYFLFKDIKFGSTVKCSTLHKFYTVNTQKIFKFPSVSGKVSEYQQADGSRNNFVSNEACGLYLPHCEEKGLGQSQHRVQHVEWDSSLIIRMRGDTPPLAHKLSCRANG